MSTGLSPTANDLALWVLNTGELYPRLCAARATILRGAWNDRTHGGLHHAARLAFAPVVRDGAKGYAACFPESARFTTRDRLDVCEYLLEQTDSAPEDYAHCIA